MNNSLSAVPQCPDCKVSDRQVRVGRNPSGSQRFLCRICGRKYTPIPVPSGYSQETRRQAIRMCLEGQSFRSVARQLGVNPQTVVNWIDAYMAATSRAIYGLRK